MAPPRFGWALSGACTGTVRTPRADLAPEPSRGPQLKSGGSRGQSREELRPVGGPVELELDPSAAVETEEDWGDLVANHIDGSQQVAFIDPVRSTCRRDVRALVRRSTSQESLFKINSSRARPPVRRSFSRIISNSRLLFANLLVRRVGQPLQFHQTLQDLQFRPLEAPYRKLHEPVRWAHLLGPPKCERQI